jgi:signal peptidase I
MPGLPGGRVRLATDTEDGDVLRRVLKDMVLPAAVALALAFAVQAAVAKPYEIPTGSMEPTIMPHDRVVANRLVYRFRDIGRGDIIVFEPSRAALETCDAPSGVPFVKRVIGLPGDRVEVRGGRTYVNGRPYVVKDALAPDYSKRWPVVPEGRLLVLGDNRPGSCDAHLWAPDPFVPEESVIGQAEIVYWPLPHLGFLD